MRATAVELRGLQEMVRPAAWLPRIVWPPAPAVLLAAAAVLTSPPPLAARTIHIRVVHIKLVPHDASCLHQALPQQGVGQVRNCVIQIRQREPPTHL